MKPVLFCGGLGTRIYRSAELTLEEFEGPRYQRIGHIQRLMADGVLAPDLRHRRDFGRAQQAAE